MSEHTRQDVRDFYDRIGWSLQDDGLYQNARYEDLRPVSAEYIHRCHMRLGTFLAPTGDYLLDAGSGPVQYPEYLTYSQGYRYRVCADLSITALKEARKRLGEKGLFVVCDITQLPFKADVFDGIVSLHAIHHVTAEKQPTAYAELFRTLRPGHSAAIVNAWKNPALIEKLGFLVRIADYLKSAPNALKRRLGLAKPTPKAKAPATAQPTGTYTQHLDAPQLLSALARLGITAEIYPWRSLSVRFLRAVIHPWNGGKYWLRLVYWLENKYPRYFGENGQYPLIVLRKSN